MKSSDDNYYNKKQINIEKYDASEFEKEQLPFTQICNKVIQNIHNAQAFLIWIYLQSLPPTWKPNKFHIMSHFKISERTYQRIMAYLSETNLVTYTRERYENGTLGAVRLIVKNGSEFALPLDPNHTAKIVVVDFTTNHTAKIGVMESSSTAHTTTEFSEGQPHRQKTTVWLDGDHINKQTTIKEKKEINKPPISPKGVACENFSLGQMLEDNPFSIPKEVLSDWLEVRRIKKAKMTRTSWNVTNSTLKKLVEFGLNALECFETMVASGWQGIKVSYFQREIDLLKTKIHKDNEQNIRERELKAKEEKRIEIDQSKEFKNITSQITQRIDLDLLRQKQEAERNKLGMTAMEYHKHIISANNTRD